MEEHDIHGISGMRVVRKRGFSEAQFLVDWAEGGQSYEFATEAHDNDFFDDFIRENVVFIDPRSKLKTRKNMESVVVHEVKWKNHRFKTFEESKFLRTSHLFPTRATSQSNSSQASSSRGHTSWDPVPPGSRSRARSRSRSRSPSGSQTEEYPQQEDIVNLPGRRSPQQYNFSSPIAPEQPMRSFSDPSPISQRQMELESADTGRRVEDMEAAQQLADEIARKEKLEIEADEQRQAQAKRDRNRSFLQKNTQHLRSCCNEHCAPSEVWKNCYKRQMKSNQGKSEVLKRLSQCNQYYKDIDSPDFICP